MHRRNFITGLISLMAMPAIVRAGSLMPVKQMLIINPINELMTRDPLSFKDNELYQILRYMREQRGKYQSYLEKGIDQ